MKNNPVVITEPAAVAALKEIYQNNGPGLLEWDFSTPGQVTALDARLEAREGALTKLNLNQADLKGILKLHGVETLTDLTAVGNGLGGLDLEALPGLRELTWRDNQARFNIQCGLQGEAAFSSPDIEEALLGAVLLDPEMALPNALETGLRADDFYNEAHAEIFRACLNLDAERQPVDQVTVAEALKIRGTLEKCGGSAGLARLHDGIGLAASAGQYARLIIDRANLRRLVSLAGNIIRRSQDSPLEVEDHLDWAESKILQLRSERRADSFVKAGDKIQNEIFPAILDCKDKRREGRLALTGLPTGYDELDKLTGGLQNSDLIILSGRPGLGKTALALNLALNAAIPDQRQSNRQVPARTVAIFCLEMDHKQLLLRLIGQVGRLDFKGLRTGWTSDEDIVPLTEAVDRLGQARIYLDDTPALRVLELRAKARRLKNRLQSQGEALDLVVVDYLQLMRGSARRGAESREQEISEICSSLKALATELQLPVLVIHRINKEIDYRPDQEPELSDLMESKDLERFADLIAFIHCPEQERGKNMEPGRGRELWILKNRNGLTGKIPLDFEASSANFLPCFRKN